MRRRDLAAATGAVLAGPAARATPAAYGRPYGGY